MKLQKFKKITAGVGLTLFAMTGTAAAQDSTEFWHKANAAIQGHNHKKVNKATVEDCKAACVGEMSFVCKSFDYVKKDNSCNLSAKNQIDVGVLKTDYPDNPYDYYERLLPPDLSTVWTSNLGDIYWIGGYYGSEKPKNYMTGQLNKLGGGIWKLKGNLNRFDPNRGFIKTGAYEITFTGKDNKRFTGKQTQLNGSVRNWNGSYTVGAGYSMGMTPRNSDEVNEALKHQVWAFAKKFEDEFSERDPSALANTRCTIEMVAFFKSQNVSNDSIQTLCTK